MPNRFLVALMLFLGLPNSQGKELNLQAEEAVFQKKLASAKNVVEALSIDHQNPELRIIARSMNSHLKALGYRNFAPPPGFVPNFIHDRIPFTGCTPPPNKSEMPRGSLECNNGVHYVPQVQYSARGLIEEAKLDPRFETEAFKCLQEQKQCSNSDNYHWLDCDLVMIVCTFGSLLK